MRKQELKEFLDAKVALYQQPEFLDTDPIQIPHRFSQKEDIEISGFLTATIAWGNRKSILNSATRMMALMDNDPFDFCMNASPTELTQTESFVHRTFNGMDLKYFVQGIRNLYQAHGGLEACFTRYAFGPSETSVATGNSRTSGISKTSGISGPSRLSKPSMSEAITAVRGHFFELPHPRRSEKHFSDPSRGSAAKRLHMFLRWMVRDAAGGVDFGLWKGISPSNLSCPLDVHSGKVARGLGLLKRKANDAKAVEELDKSLWRLDPEDPVKYDFALFGLGVFEGFPK